MTLYILLCLASSVQINNTVDTICQMLIWKKTETTQNKNKKTKKQKNKNKNKTKQKNKQTYCSLSFQIYSHLLQLRVGKTAKRHMSNLLHCSSLFAIKYYETFGS